MHDKMLHISRATLLCLAALLFGCGPRANIPPRPAVVPASVGADHSAAVLARTLAPTLYLHPNEWFPLERVVAAVHPTRRIIAYYLLWADDVHGSWIPFTVATDQEIGWVAYDSSGRATDLYSFWHGTVVHADWRDRAAPAFDVQWGKHGLLPRHTIESDLPAARKLNQFYLFTWLALPDVWLGNLTRPGPWCFCRSYGRYRQYTIPLELRDRLDAIVVTDDPHEALSAVFGRRYSRKRQWPD